MKKILFLLLTTISINYVYAKTEENIDYIKYKWYIEERIDTKYYPKKDNLSGYYEDPTIMEYSNQTQWGKSYCEYNRDNYLIEEYVTTKYKRPINTKYIVIDFETDDNYKNIKIFDNNYELTYHVLTSQNNIIKLALDKEYNTIYLHFYIDTESNYSISLYNDFDLTKQSISNYINPTINGKTIYPAKEWINNNTILITEGTTGNAPDMPLIVDIQKETICRVKEISTLRYKIKKKYYDDNYHTYIEGYIPDIKESIIYYKEEKPVNNQETIIKTKIETKIKTIKEKIYEYLKPDKETITKTVYKDKYKNKYIYKKIIPKTVYIIIILLIIIILTCLIKILFKIDD